MRCVGGDEFGCGNNLVEVVWLKVCTCRLRFILENNKFN